MGLVIVTNGRYTIDDPLYQWDLNKVLEIRGLSLASIPEIHFVNSAMDRAIVRQAKMDAAGVITVDVPNSLLQKPYKVKVYICIYRGASFETLYSLEIPVVARPRPSDYTISDNDGEIYSFNALENAVNNALAELEDLEGKATAAVAKINAAETEAIKEITDAAEEIIANMGGGDVASKADLEALSNMIDENYADLEHSHEVDEVNGIPDWAKEPIKPGYTADEVSGLADFIVEQGVTNGWIWRKWNSGIGECWYRHSGNSKIQTIWGQVYESGLFGSVNYPFTFTEIPLEFASPGNNEKCAWVEVSSGANQTTRHTNVYQLVTGKQITTEVHVEINIYAIGKWK